MNVPFRLVTEVHSPDRTRSYEDDQEKDTRWGDVEFVKWNSLFGMEIHKFVYFVRILSGEETLAKGQGGTYKPWSCSTR